MLVESAWRRAAQSLGLESAWIGDFVALAKSADFKMAREQNSVIIYWHSVPMSVGSPSSSGVNDVAPLG